LGPAIVDTGETLSGGVRSFRASYWLLAPRLETNLKRSQSELRANPGLVNSCCAGTAPVGLTSETVLASYVRTTAVRGIDENTGVLSLREKNIFQSLIAIRSHRLWGIHGEIIPKYLKICTVERYFARPSEMRGLRIADCGFEDAPNRSSAVD
jgi:hypothetical protein